MRENRRARLSRLSAAAVVFVLLCCLMPSARASTIDAYNPQYPDVLNEEHLAAESAILIEASTGEVIFEKNADRVMYPASTTKIMTALLGILMADLNQTVVASPTAVSVPSDSSTIPLQAGETINFTDLLYATMIKSGNDGANVIAETVSGSIENFVLLMNQTASVFGCTNTHFNNAHGYHDEYHYTTARDLAVISRQAMQQDLFRQIVATTRYQLPASNISKGKTLYLDNAYLSRNENYESSYYQYGTGIKTGRHSAAGYCYVGSASKDGVTLISVVLKTTMTGRWQDTIKLMNYGFSQYVSVTPVELYNMNPKQVEITGFSLDDENIGRLPLSIRKLDASANDYITTTKDRVDYLAQRFNSLFTVDFTREFTAPVEKGEVMGTVTYYPADGEPVEYELIAGRSIKSRAAIGTSPAELRAQVDNDPNPFPSFSFRLFMLFALPTLAVLALIFLIRFLIRFAKKHKHKKTVRPSGRYYR